jgi:DNA-binding transcriptional ArsR family regulator
MPPVQKLTTGWFFSSAGSLRTASGKSRKWSMPMTVAFLKVLGHEGRLELLCHMIDGAQSVGALTQALGSSQPAVSQHLMRLRAEGLVRTERRGKSVLYSIAAPELATIIAALRDAFCTPPNAGQGAV